MACCAVQSELDAQRERSTLLQESMQRLEAEVAPEEPPGLTPPDQGDLATPRGILATSQGLTQSQSLLVTADLAGTPGRPPSADSSSMLAAANSQLTRKVVELSENFSRWVPLWARPFRGGSKHVLVGA